MDVAPISIINLLGVYNIPIHIISVVDMGIFTNIGWTTKKPIRYTNVKLISLCHSGANTAYFLHSKQYEKP